MCGPDLALNHPNAGATTSVPCWRRGPLRRRSSRHDRGPPRPRGTQAVAHRLREEVRFPHAADHRVSRRARSPVVGVVSAAAGPIGFDALPLAGPRLLVAAAEPPVHQHTAGQCRGDGGEQDGPGRLCGAPGRLDGGLGGGDELSGVIDPDVDWGSGRCAGGDGQVSGVGLCDGVVPRYGYLDRRGAGVMLARLLRCGRCGQGERRVQVAVRGLSCSCSPGREARPWWLP